jgi:hypothetical protein
VAGAAFDLWCGGFHPRYKDIPKELTGLERVTIDLSPVKDEKGKGKGPIKIVVTCYFAVTAGAIMAGVKGDFKADVAVASAHAWLSLDMIFYWVPRFGFAIDLEIGLDIEVFGCSFASVSFKGSLQGTQPVYGHAADVHAHLAGDEGNESLLRSAQAVVDLQGFDCEAAGVGLQSAVT